MLTTRRSLLKMTSVAALLLLNACSSMRETDLVLYDNTLEVSDFANSPYAFITK